MILRHYDRKLKSSSLSEVDAMAINALSNAKRSLQELVQKADPAAKEQLTAIANALEDVEERLKALEAVVDPSSGLWSRSLAADATPEEEAA